MHLTLKLIEQATLLGEVGNFAKAAEQLGISQPTLSRNIAALEEDLGLRLFDRGRGGAALTVFGRVLAERGARVLGEAQALRAELLAVAGMDSGRLDVVAGPYATEDPIAEAVARLVQERPGLRVRIHVVDPNEVLPAVLSGDHELGFGGRSCLLPHEHLALELFTPRRLLLACRPGHPLLSLRPSMAQVLAFPLVGTLLKGRNAIVAATGDAAGAPDNTRRGFSPAIEVNSFDAARRIARSSDALFPATTTMLAADLAVGHLATLDFDAQELRYHPALARLSDRTLSPAADRLLQIVRKLDAELGASSLPLAATPAPLSAAVQAQAA
jgi:DNA-binding transcriptional LysR family regulator